MHRERRVIGISRSLIWSKTLMELIFNPCGEFRWSPEAPVSQIHSPHLHVGAPGIYLDLFRYYRESRMRKVTGSYRTYLISGKTAVLVHEFAVEDLPSTELQPSFLRLQLSTCPWAEHSGGCGDTCINIQTLKLINFKTTLLEFKPFPWYVFHVLPIFPNFHLTSNLDFTA